jgi:hypothetical protein
VVNEDDDETAACPLPYVGDQREEGPNVLQSARCLHSCAHERPDDDDIHLELTDVVGHELSPRIFGESELRPRIFEHGDTAPERRARPGVSLASQLAPKARPWPLVLDQEDASRPRNLDPEPVIAGCKVAGEVDPQRRLPGTAVSVEHDVAVLGNDSVVGIAEDRLAAFLVGAGELVKRNNAKGGREGLPVVRPGGG